MSEIWLGVDPDLHNTGLALADARTVYRVGVVSVSRKFAGVTAVIAMCDAITTELEKFLNEGFTDSGYNMSEWGVVVEGQKYILGGSAKKATPEDLINLATVTGAAISTVCARGYGNRVLRPIPSEWKGSVPKGVHQAKTCKKYGWGYTSHKDYVVPEMDTRYAPEGVNDLKASDWKHVLDAVGMAYWGATRVTPERLEA